MSKKMFMAAALLSLIRIAPVCAQDFSKLNFNIGGGMTSPINPTANFVGLSGNFAVGAGYNITKRHSIIGEFMWNGLNPNTVFHPINAPFGNINLYSITTNYRYQRDRIGGSLFGLYVIGGGGWYYRHITIDREFFIDPVAPCLPIYDWWGFTCADDGYVITQRIASKGSSAGGINAGTGFTIGISDTGWKFYVESRYNYAWTNRVPTTFIPITFGFRYR